MTAPYWSLPYLVSSVPILMILTRTVQPTTGAAGRGRAFYRTSLFFILVWEALDLVNLFIPLGENLTSNLINRLLFVSVSLVVCFFVLSSIYLQGTPRLFQKLIAVSPPILTGILNLLDPFTTFFGSFGWRGDFANSMLRDIWLTVTLGVLVWSLVNLYLLRGKTVDPRIRRRMTYFVAGYLVAFVSGFFVYLFVNSGLELSVVAVGVSLIISAPAFG
ncbi:MAG TPA: hypothetical protein VLV31_03150 [Candidatus Acidoferrales bacterium]|nr:hypothetical protein [Candidatus Acidoferrales bacterium]